MIELIVDVQACLQAFVGVAKDLNAIVIAFRGTQESSIQNWIEDLYWKQLDCNYPGTSDAMVHHGFYSAYHNTSVRPGILSVVKSAKELCGDLQIMVTGHSIGGAMAAFCGLDLRIGVVKKAATQELSYIDKWMAPKNGQLPLLFFPTRAEVLPEPLGIILIFVSWNFPINPKRIQQDGTYKCFVLTSMSRPGAVLVKTGGYGTMEELLEMITWSSALKVISAAC